jgi:hypothetical protein
MVDTPFDLAGRNSDARLLSSLFAAGPGDKEAGAAGPTCGKTVPVS